MKTILLERFYIDETTIKSSLVRPKIFRYQKNSKKEKNKRNKKKKKKKEIKHVCDPFYRVSPTGIGKESSGDRAVEIASINRFPPSRVSFPIALEPPFPLLFKPERNAFCHIFSRHGTLAGKLLAGK